ncbi:hypothetical protein E3N88_26449 [Mikania micrantha]|uniref:photosystem I n=1 Tax=Mikania micrantha TaxID=192012 RepID=A0A5N6N998_9ASTR|nr:hypothetical protein E3N88_26449 [Mikania micrantha]
MLPVPNVGVVLMGDGLLIQEGSSVKATGRIAQIPVSEAYLGRVINALAKPIDGRGEISSSEYRLIESPAPGIISRRSVYEPLQTGLIAIDSMIPIGRGQRELIIGDRQTGKTAVATDTILNQQGQNVICVYVAIGQKASSVAQVVTTFQERGAMEYTIVVAETADSPATLQYLAPYTGAALAEFFIRNETKDTVELGVLFARSSRLIPDKANLGFRFPCDGPGRGGTCQVSAWDHVFLGLFWMYNAISVVIFHFSWKMQSDVWGSISDQGVVTHITGGNFAQSNKATLPPTATKSPPPQVKLVLAVAPGAVAPEVVEVEEEGKEVKSVSMRRTSISLGVGFPYRGAIPFETLLHQSQKLKLQFVPLGDVPIGRITQEEWLAASSRKPLMTLIPTQRINRRAPGQPLPVILASPTILSFQEEMDEWKASKQES